MSTTEERLKKTVEGFLAEALEALGIKEAKEYLRNYGPDILEALEGAVRQYHSDLLTALADDEVKLS